MIIGSGIAGLSFALKIAESRPDLSIALITKSSSTETNTRYAQGGIAAVIDTINDSFQQHIDDTLKAGGGLCDEKVAEMVVKKAPQRLRELIEWGVDFDRLPGGSFSKGLEGGHSNPRILHHKDMTGFEIEHKLFSCINRNHPNISIYSHHFAIDLITSESDSSVNDNKTCLGAYIYDQHIQRIKVFASKVTILATGGSGQVYETTTNPLIATGDGVAMAYRADAIISDMAYIQFHPTALYQTGTTPAFLISEAVRGFGAFLVNGKGDRFVFDYDERGELATRDIISNAIYHELIKSGESSVFLDCRHLNKEEFRIHFPNIYDHCLNLGMDIFKDRIPVLPAAHYQCGGIAVDLKSRTSIKNLYACGECSSTGLHGSNRLASNSLLEAVVFSHEAYLDVLKRIDTLAIPDEIPLSNFHASADIHENAQLYMRTIRQLMSRYAGIVKTQRGLSEIIKKLNEMEHLIQQKSEILKNADVSFWELRNLLCVAQIIVIQSLQKYEENIPIGNINNLNVFC